VYLLAGDTEHAEPLLERAIAILEKALGLGAPDLTSPLTTLAQVLTWNGDSVRKQGRPGSAGQTPSPRGTLALRRALRLRALAAPPLTQAHRPIPRLPPQGLEHAARAAPPPSFVRTQSDDERMTIPRPQCDQNWVP
jgi:hypothetical protein